MAVWRSAMHITLFTKCNTYSISFICQHVMRISSFLVAEILRPFVLLLETVLKSPKESIKISKIAVLL